MPLFVSSSLVSSVICIATIYLAEVRGSCHLFLFDLFDFSLCFLEISLVRPSCLFCLPSSSCFTCMNGHSAYGYCDLPCFLFWFLHVLKGKIKQGQGETHSFPDLQKNMSGDVFLFYFTFCFILLYFSRTLLYRNFIIISE